MDILYIVGKGFSKCDNFELRCSLRSLEKYGKNIRKVYIAGYCPEWLSDEVVKIPIDDNPWDGRKGIRYKHLNMTYTLLEAVKRSDIGEEFLVSMDDHFYIKPVDFDNYPFYAKLYGQSCEVPIFGDTVYKIFLSKVRGYLEMAHLSTINYTLHRNMHIFRRDINECYDDIIKAFKNKRSFEPFLYLNNYAHTKYNTPFTPIQDAKIEKASEYNAKVTERDQEVFSTVDFNKDSDLYKLLESLYNFKSKYEK